MIYLFNFLIVSQSSCMLSSFSTPFPLTEWSNFPYYGKVLKFFFLLDIFCWEGFPLRVAFLSHSIKILFCLAIFFINSISLFYFDSFDILNYFICFMQLFLLLLSSFQHLFIYFFNFLNIFMIALLKPLSCASSNLTLLGNIAMKMLIFRGDTLFQLFMLVRFL